MIRRAEQLKQGDDDMGYPDNFDGAACDAAQGEPVDYDQPLLAASKRSSTPPPPLKGR